MAPWAIGDVDSHKKGLSAKGKARWVAIANSVYKKCMAEGGTDKTCAPKAIRQANGVVNNEDEQQNYHTFSVPQD